MADQTGSDPVGTEVTDSTGTTARPAENPGIDPADLQQGSAVESDSEVADPDGNEARDDEPAEDGTGVAPFGVGRFGMGGVTLDR
jgi:hypothetical protein